MDWKQNAILTIIWIQLVVITDISGSGSVEGLLEMMQEQYGVGTSEDISETSHEARRYVPFSTEDLIILFRKEFAIVSSIEKISENIHQLLADGEYSRYRNSGP